MTSSQFRIARAALGRVLIASMLAAAATPLWAANECRVTIAHFGDGTSKRPMLKTVATLSVGDISRQELDWIDFLRNEGPHDVRVSFVGAPARQLARGESDPTHGRFDRRVALKQIECLATRSTSVDAPRRWAADDLFAAAAAETQGASR